MRQWPDLRKILEDFDWVIIGGVATRAYMPERVTKDMDILVREEDGRDVLDRLQKAGFAVVSPLSIGGYMLSSLEGVEIDLIFGNQTWLAEALANPDYDFAGYPVLGLPYLILMKMMSARGRDFGDVTTMLGWADDDALEKVRQVITKFSPQDKDDLESLIFLGQQERQLPDDLI